MESTTMTIAEALGQAVAAHQAGRLQDAEGLYLAILQADPRQPDANHNLGVLAVQVGKPEAALEPLRLALEAVPSMAQYWQSYVEALLRTRQFAVAGEVLEQARAHGLAEEMLSLLTQRLEAARAEAESGSPGKIAVAGSAPGTSAGDRGGGRKKRQQRTKGRDKAPRESGPALGRDGGVVAGQGETDAIAALIDQGRLDEAEARCRGFIADRPGDGFGPKALGIVLMRRGQVEAALEVFARGISLAGDDAQYAFLYARALQAAGRHDAAAQHYERALAVSPDMAEAGAGLGDALRELGRLDEALERCEAVVARHPGHADALRALGHALRRLGRQEEAAARYEQVLALHPEAVEVRNNLGNTLRDLGRLEEAVEHYREALRQCPEAAVVRCNLGEALRRLGHLDEALTLYAALVQQMPSLAAAQSGYGRVLQDLGRFDDAERHYRQALDLDPDQAETHNNLGSVLHALGRYDAAVASVQRAITLRPDFADAYNNWGNALQKLGRLGEAARYYEKALALCPDYVEALNNLANVVKDLGQPEFARTLYCKALQINPDFVVGHFNLGNLLKQRWQLDEAVAQYKKALALRPGSFEICNNLANTLKDMARHDEALDSFEQALTANPDYAPIMSNALFVRNITTPNQAALYEAYRRFSELYERPLRPSLRPHGNAPHPGRPLRIGYVSGDFREHALYYFIGRVFEHHDKDRFSVVCYQTSPKTDAVSDLLRERVSQWRSIVDLSDDAAADMIRADGIDILVDLSGHTAGNRLLVFARKPAPVQVTWLGFLNTTGLAAMDYILCNRWLVRPDDAPFCSERPWYLDGAASCFWNPALRDDLPIGPLPALDNGYLTFGSFNQFCKIDDRVVDCWIRILTALPDSRLQCKAKIFNNAAMTEAFRARFVARGIAPDRLDLQPAAVMREYLLGLNGIDIGLDTFPYNGGTITCHSLTMGVPVLTLSGQSVISHAGESILRPLGLDDWVASDADDYVAKAVAWAGRLDELAALRQSLRQRFAREYGDAAGFTRRLEAAYRGMWERWCAGRPGTESRPASRTG